MTSYFGVAQALLDGLEGDPRSALAGGVAVGAHGYVRATKDVDIVVGIPLTEAQARLAAHGISATLKTGDPLEGDFSCLRGSLGGVPFDVIPQLVPIAWERVLTVSLAGGTVRVVDLESLLALKLKAGSSRDVLDVAMLVLLHPEREAVAHALARTHRVDDILQRYLADPRIQADAARLLAEPDAPEP